MSWLRDSLVGSGFGQCPGLLRLPSRIVCDLPARPGRKGSDWFSLVLHVDGEEVENNKNLRYYSSYTPELQAVQPRYGKPGEIVTFKVC